MMATPDLPENVQCMVTMLDGAEAALDYETDGSFGGETKHTVSGEALGVVYYTLARVRAALIEEGAAWLREMYDAAAKERQKRKSADSVPVSLPEQKGDAREHAGKAFGGPTARIRARG